MKNVGLRDSGFELFFKNAIVTLQVLHAILSYRVKFSRSSALRLFLACQKSSLFQSVQHRVEGAMSEFYVEVCFNFFLDSVTPDGGLRLN